jgi:hypothetical protein
MALIAPDQRSAAINGAGPTSLTPTRKYILAATIGLCAVIWFLVLSGWLGVTPGGVMTTRYNILFSSDTSIWINTMVGDTPLPVQYAHPLQVVFWRPPCLVLYHLLKIFLPPEYAAVFATRLLVAIIGGIGVGFLALLALHNGAKITQCLLLFIMYLLFTCNSTAALPEHFGISAGLLSVAFVIPFLIASALTRTVILAVLAAFIGGTTITNTLFPVAYLAHLSIRSVRVKIALILAAIPVSLGGTLFLYRASDSIHSFISRYLNLRLIHDPLGACVYTIFALIGPVIGPVPRVLRVPGWDMVSYEPGHAALQLNYSWMQAIGVVAWVVLLIICVSRGLKEDRIRPYVLFLLGWFLFNTMFHNIWGDEFILYSPHWAWALMALVILGARDLSRTFIATIFVSVVASQIYSLLAIKAALQTISR